MKVAGIVAVLLAVLLIATTAIAETPKTIDSKGLWEKYRTVLFDFLRNGDDKALPGLQLVTTPVSAEWEENPEAFNLITNTIPNWGISWDMSSRTFYKEYHRFLTNLKMPPSSPNKELEKKLREMEDRYFELTLDIEDLEYQLSERYDRMKSVQRRYSTVDKFVRTNLTWRRLEEQRLQLLADTEMLKVPGWGKWFLARTALGKYLTTPEEDRTFLSLGSLKRFREEALNDQTNSFEVKVTSKTVTSTRKTYEQGIGVGINLSFAETVSVGVKGNFQKSGMNFKTSTDELQIIIGAKGWKAIPVKPKSTWYEPEVFEKYRNEAMRTNINFFGKKSNKKSIESARVPHYPKTLFLAVKPYVTMFVSREDAEEIQKSKSFSLEANIGVSFGNFDFNFNKADSFEFKQENSKLYKVTMTGNSPTPVLMAVDNHILAN
mmetsp:Transcript_12687/g.19039  ORF Transcript_12687/g.19039 Transcript_12687/m.19039 type:complete len:434 (-) Transcript_12687:80-1381(-)